MKKTAAVGDDLFVLAVVVVVDTHVRFQTEQIDQSIGYASA
jgi:hypothetical protein